MDQATTISNKVTVHKLLGVTLEIADKLSTVATSCLQKVPPSTDKITLDHTKERTKSCSSFCGIHCVLLESCNDAKISFRFSFSRITPLSKRKTQ